MYSKLLMPKETLVQMANFLQEVLTKCRLRVTLPSADYNLCFILMCFAAIFMFTVHHAPIKVPTPNKVFEIICSPIYLHEGLAHTL